MEMRPRERAKDEMMDTREKLAHEQGPVRRQRVIVGRTSLHEETMCMDGVKVGEIGHGAQVAPVTPKTLINFEFPNI